MSWGVKPTEALPSAVVAVMDGLAAQFTTALVRPGVPPNFDYGVKLITVRRIGGQPDPDDPRSDEPIVMIGCYAPTYLLASELAGDVQLTVLSWPLTEIGVDDPVLVEWAEIYVGEQEVPDLYPDERRINSSYRLGLRRQFRP